MRTFLAAGAALLLALGRRSGAAQQRRCSNRRAATGLAAGAAAARPTRPSSLPSSAPASTSSASTSSSRTRTATRSPICKQSRLRRRRGRQAAEDRHVQADQARRRHGRRDQGAAEGNPHRLRRGIGGGARRRASVRDFSRRLPRAPRREHGGARTAGAVHRDAARAVRHGRRDVSARVDRLGPDDAQSLGGRRADSSSSSAASTSTSRRTSSRSSTRTTRPRRSSEIRNQVSLSALKALIVHMGSLKEGRKSLILVSEGYTYMVPPQMRNADAQQPGLGNPERSSTRTPAQNDINEDRATWSAGLDMDSDLREIYDTANRNNVAIYAVDPRGLPGFEFDINEGVGLQTDSKYLSSTMDTLRDAGGEHRRPRHRQPQRPRRRHEADHARLERLLPDRLQLGAGAHRRQVPRDQGEGEAAGRAGARAARATGRSTARKWRARPRRPSRRRRSRSKRRSPTPWSGRRARASCAPGSARRAARTARRASRSCGSRCRSRRAIGRARSRRACR